MFLFEHPKILQSMISEIVRKRKGNYRNVIYAYRCHPALSDVSKEVFDWEIVLKAAIGFHPTGMRLRPGE
ncbi:hypothetical protein QE390_004256 [Siphonobacter sp. SORGH_AS 1065]|nr:hypothetical protein [Siphonobacter sp. SORGH_AS_1065]